MIDERREEQASLYVLGSLEGAELREFETALQQDADLQKLVAAFRVTVDAMAGNAPLVRPPAGLKQRILNEIDRGEKIVPMTPQPEKRTTGIGWFPWALAACFMVLCAVIAVQKSNQQTQSQAEMNAMRQTIATLESTTNDLHKTVQDLVRKNELVSLRIAVLESLVPESKAVAVTLWDDSKQHGMLLVQKLQTLPADKDYQLWVIDPNAGSPIDAGVFKVDAQGNMRAEFKATLPVKAAQKFAVTVERKGGAPKPEGKMVLIGG